MRDIKPKGHGAFGVHGPGGHSWWDRGRPSALHTLVSLLTVLLAEGSPAAPLNIGRVASIEHNHTAVQEALPGGPAVAIKIVPADGHSAVQFGRHFDYQHLLYAHVTRESINVLKENFREALTKPEWKTVIKLKNVLGVD